jgi:hypothetical protein
MNNDWKPIITLGNSWVEYLIAIILIKPASYIVAFIIGFSYGFLTSFFGYEINNNFVQILTEISYLISFFGSMYIATKLVRKKLIRAYQKDLSEKNK